MDSVERINSKVDLTLTRVIEVPKSPNLKEHIGWDVRWVVDKRPVDIVPWIEDRIPESVLLKVLNEVSGNPRRSFDSKADRSNYLLNLSPTYKGIYNELRLDFLEKVSIDEKVNAYGNLLVNGGMDLIWDAVIGNAVTVYSNANAAIGVGDSSTAAAVGQTNLQASTNKLRKGMNASFPDQPSNPSVRFQSDFTGAEANFQWLEVGTFNNTSDGSGTMLHRLVPSGGLGTKSSGATWTITVTITLS